MNRILVAGSLLAAVGLLTSCSGRRDSAGTPSEVKVPTEVENRGRVDLQDRTVPVPQGEDAVKTALETLFKYAKNRTNSIPEGTKLLSLKIEDGVARINVSKEFNKLEGAGNEGESMAQQALVRTLSQFKEIDKMLVLVEGKPFESEHTDWSDPIPVRGEEDVARRERRSGVGVPPGGGD